MIEFLLALLIFIIGVIVGIISTIALNRYISTVLKNSIDTLKEQLKVEVKESTPGNTVISPDVLDEWKNGMVGGTDNNE